MSDELTELRRLAAEAHVPVEADEDVTLSMRPAMARYLMAALPLVDALLAHGSEHGVVILPDGTLRALERVVYGHWEGYRLAGIGDNDD